GARAALVKGGHLSDAQVTDAFATAEGVAILSGPRIESRHTHGTGCTLSSAIAAFAARNGDSPQTGVRLPSVEQARDYLMRAIDSGSRWTLSRTPTLGHGPVDHFVDAL
ncbi:bifunctional hydroxymethylpyrimidine kinase/phosphomethylpyrimidine kinase, partial [Tessaracoccus lubricantis]